MLTVADLKSGSGSIPEPEAQERVDSAISLWERLTGRLWVRRASHVQTIRPRTNRLRTLLLELWPVETITSVETLDDSAGATWETVTSSNYRLEGDRQLRYLAGYWPSFVRVTYTGGYIGRNESVDGATVVPMDVRRALLTQIEFERARFASEKIAIRSQNFEGGAGVFETADVHPYTARLARAWGAKS